ncbi:major facilitator superfamily domain-containing protein [Apiospora marii]|uniref:major facilitator superfamily domain-containing protein n=1 Tax=Apiospora marii TaxID=335849 RepID=UPI0031300821
MLGRATSWVQRVLRRTPGEYVTVAEERLVRKLDFMICPIFFLINFASLLDRSNIGNAKIQGMDEDLGLNIGNRYNLVLVVFFVPYILLEIPSNLIVRHVRPSYYLSALIFSWGIVVMCEGFVNTYQALIGLRFLLGALEAGIFPGILYVTSMYYKRFEYQGRLTAIWSSAILSNAFGGLLAYSIAHLDGHFGIFIIEGAATAFLGTVAFFWIPDWPEQNKYLSVADKEMIRQRLLSDQPTNEEDELSLGKLGAILRDWKICISALIAFGGIVTAYSMTLFLPTILNGFGWDRVAVQLHTIPVWAVAFVVAAVVSWASDRLQHRSLFILGLSVPPTVGYAILLRQDAFSRRAQYAATFLVVLGVATTPFAYAWLMNNLRGHGARAVGSAVMNSVGNLGGVVASNIFMGRDAPRYYAGYGTALACIWVVVVGTVVMAVVMYMANRTRRHAEGTGLSDTEQSHSTEPAYEYTL